MTETTTIEITKKQKADLDSLKTHEDESYKSVIGRMLESGGVAAPVEELVETQQEIIETQEKTMEEIREQRNMLLGKLEDMGVELPTKLAEELR